MIRGIRKVVNRLGWDLRRNPIPFDPAYIRQRLLGQLSIDLVIDVGANAGQYGAGVFEQGFMGRIISFEPLDGAFEQLKRGAATRSRWECRHEALGAVDGTAEINVCDTMSSILPKSDGASDAVQFSFKQTQSITIRKLDGIWKEVLGKDRRPWLKMDVQGYEKSVLDGAGAALKDVIAVEMELSLWPFYEGQPLYQEMLDRMSGVGFDLWSISPGSRTSGGQMIEMDGIFVRRGVSV